MKCLWRNLSWAGSLAALSIGLLACHKPAPPEPGASKEWAPAAPSAGPVLKVLATHDLRNVQALTEQITHATGVRLQWVFEGTMDSTEAILTGRTDADVAWLANAKLLLSEPEGAARVKHQDKIMNSPLAVGVSQSTAESLGWTDPAVVAKVSWSTLTDAASDGRIRYALPNPATSNQGYMALMGVIAAASDRGDALRADDIDRPAIRRFLTGYQLRSDQSSELRAQFIEQQGAKVNTLINYESELLSLNRSGELHEPLVLIYPREGVATADYPFMLLNEDRREDYQKVAHYLHSEGAQTWLAEHTLRHPTHPQVASQLRGLWPPTEGLRIELPFSPNRALSRGLIDAYLDELRRPLASTFVLDTSASMKGSRRDQLVQALHDLAGADTSLTGRLSRLTYRERIWVLPFADTPGQLSAFELPALSRPSGGPTAEDTQALARALDRFTHHIDSLRMDGGTALYDSVLTALRHMHTERQRQPAYQYAVIAFTDGQDTRGSLDAFEQAYALLPPEVHQIPVYMILYGEAFEADLYRLVEVTGGQVFDARRTPLSRVFKDIRALQ